MSTKLPPMIGVLLDALDRGHSLRSWRGPNLRGAIRGITLAETAYRPAPGRHNVGEIVVHCAYWKYVAWRRLADPQRGSFGVPGSDWRARPVRASAQARRDDVRLLDLWHRRLRRAVAAMPEKELHDGPPGSSVSNLMLITGVAMHGVYHAGQIQLLKRLARGRR